MNQGPPQKEPSQKRRRTYTAAAWTSIAVSAALTLALIDWTNTGRPRPLWALLLPALSGILGWIAGLLANKPLLSFLAAAFGLLAIPAAIFSVTLHQGP